MSANTGSNLLKYKEYFGTVEFDLDSKRLYGRVIGLNDKISYEATDLEGLEKDFREAIDDYIAFCQEKGKEPEKSFSGRILLRVSPEVHGLVAQAAQASGKSINAWLSDAVQAAVQIPRAGR